MARPESNRPTELELEILKILWVESPLAVRDVRTRLADGAGRELTHSSVITMLNIMVRKRYLSRWKEGKAFLFSPRIAQESVSGSMLRDLAARLFNGSSSALALNLIESAELDSDELQDLRKLIQRKSKEQRS
jgi:predicted transcriptional regulator